LFEFSAKVDKGQGTGPAVLLWPADNSWPPEIDLLEAPDANRQGMYFTVHWKDNNGNHAYKSYKFDDVDASQWHTYGLEWERNKLVFYVDGVKRQEHYEGDPNMKMAFGIQMFVASEWDAWYGGPPNQATMDNGKIDLSVDWVRVAQKSATTSSPPTSPTSPQPITGTSSADTLRGTEQGEVINGLAGNDTIYGNGGNDTIIGGSGRDQMTGGAGSDTFDFNAYAESYPYSSLRDQILDFTPGTDKIDLSTIDANSSASGDQAFGFQGTVGFSGGGKGSVRYSQGGSSSSPYTLVDVDNGNGGSPEMSIQLSGWKTLAGADFVL
jgi:hypothetical protein